MSAKYLASVLALAAGAFAQSSVNTCSNAATLTIASAADAAAITACSTYTGSIAIATGTTDNIALNGVNVIQGGLTANNVTQITQLSGSSLTTISGAFTLNGLTILSTLNFPQLTNVGSIMWQALPALQGLSFTTGVQMTSTLNVQNTQLNSLTGIDLAVVDTVYIANNPYLNNINMQLGNVTTALTIEANGGNMSVIMPNMIWANNMTFRNVSAISIPSLQAVNGSMGFYSNELTMLSAANLTSVGQSLSFVSNTALTNVTMPQLKTIGGGFQVANNTMLKVLNGFPKLATVSGAVDLHGNFTNVTLPGLSDVKGAFNLQSSADIDDACNTFKSLASSNGVIKGKFTCAGEQAKPAGTGSSVTGTATGSASTSSSTAKSAASGLFVPTVASGLIGAVAVLFGLM